MEKYNTLKDGAKETLLGGDNEFNVKNYTYDIDRFTGAILYPYIIMENSTNKTYENEKIYNRTDDYTTANKMAMKIREYDSNYFIIIVSNYGWESRFSKELGLTLENCGSFLIKEMLFKGFSRFGDFTKT